MFDMLADRLGKAIDSLRGRGRVTEENVADTLRQVRMALLEADVAVPVVKSFTDAARARAIGTEVMKSLTPGQAFIGVIHEELTRVMGEPGRGLNLHAPPPVVVLLAGLQGAGKTTTAAKLARHLIEKHRRKPLLVSTDVYRPAAMTQLERLAEQVEAAYFNPPAGSAPVAIATAALDHARRHMHDVVIVDTAGRLHVDQGMMDEVQGDRPGRRRDRTPVRGRQHGRPGRGPRRGELQCGARPHRRDPHQGRWRRTRRCGALRAAGHRQADPVRRCRREDRRARGFSPRAHRLAHPRHGRRAFADRTGADDG